MNATRAAGLSRTAWVLFGALILSAAAVKPVQDLVDRRLSLERSVDPDLLYVASPNAVMALSLGYQALAADLYWIRTVQYYGRRDEAGRRAVRYKNLASLLDITTTLDPDMIDVYRAGASFLSEPDPVGAGDPGQALRLLEKGISHHPEDWWLHFDRGFVHFWFLNDFREAGKIWLAASRLKDAPPWMEGLAAMGLSRGGAVETARVLWERQYQDSPSREVRENAKNHLLSMRTDELLWTIEFFAEKYAAARGRFPARLDELVEARYLASVPTDPSGVPFEYDAAAGTARLSPRTGVRYLKVPYDYREAYRRKLEAAYASGTRIPF